jgi:hypothetical protein
VAVSHHISLDLASLDPAIAKYLKWEIGKATRHEIRVKMVKSRYVKSGKLDCSGTANYEEIAIAIKRPQKSWLMTAVHEFSHMDQIIEKSPAYFATVDGFDPSTIVDMWLHNVCELTTDQLYRAITALRELELDCERRAAQKVIDWALPISHDEYVKKANAYIYFHHFIAMTRKWYKDKFEPDHVPEVWRNMPTHFDNDYETLPDQYRNLFLRYCIA